MLYHFRKTAQRTILLFCAMTMCLISLPPVAFPVSAEGAYVEPGYVVDFSDYDTIDTCYDVFHITPTVKNGAMNIAFTDTGAGNCFDPYLSLALDAGKFSCEEYPYLALLVKTNKHDLKGQLRFRTSSTGGEYPCQEFSYQKTDDWQVVVIHLTNRSSLLFYPPNGELSGGYTNLRLDSIKFENRPEDFQEVVDKIDAELFGLFPKE